MIQAGLRINSFFTNLLFQEIFLNMCRFSSFNSLLPGLKLEWHIFTTALPVPGHERVKEFDFMKFVSTDTQSMYKCYVSYHSTPVVARIHIGHGYISQNYLLQAWKGRVNSIMVSISICEAHHQGLSPAWSVCISQKGGDLPACYQLVPTSAADWFNRGGPCVIMSMWYCM